MEPNDVVIVGAGLAGLACAVTLREAGIDCLLLDASDGVGGRVRTDRVVADGAPFLLDRGFQVFLAAYPEARRLLDYQGLDLRPFAPGAVVRTGGGFHTVADPLRRPLTALKTLIAPVGGFADKVRVFKLRRRARAAVSFAGEETTALEALRGLGFSEGMIDAFFRPFLGGIFLDRELVTSSYAMDFVIAMQSRGAIALPAAGMGAIAAQLAAALPAETLRLETPVAAVGDRSLTLASGVTLAAERIVVATDGPAAAHLIGKRVADPGSRGVTCLYFAAETAPIAGPWLVLNGDGPELVQNLAVLDQVAARYAPPGAHLISATVLGESDLHDQELEKRVRRQLAGWFGQRVAGWRHLRTYRIRHALPAQPPGFRARRPASPRLRPGLYLAGDHVEDASINGALASGRRAAEAVIADF